MISRDHSEIIGEVDKNGKFLRYYIRDNSLNGTYVNETRVSTVATKSFRDTCVSGVLVSLSRASVLVHEPHTQLVPMLLPPPRSPT